MVTLQEYVKRDPLDVDAATARVEIYTPMTDQWVAPGGERFVGVVLT